MGVEPFLISSTLMAVLAQRLVRTVCKKCRTPFEPTESQLVAAQPLAARHWATKCFITAAVAPTAMTPATRAEKAFSNCSMINDAIRALINERAPTVVLRQKAVELGMVTLREDGLRGIFDGDTTIEEVVKYYLNRRVYVMPKFSYVAMDSRGKETKGTLRSPAKTKPSAASRKWAFSPPRSSRSTKAKEKADDKRRKPRQGQSAKEKGRRSTSTSRFPV